MGLLTNKVQKSDLKPGDHIYTYRALFAYSHHGIYVGGSKVVHFTPRRETTEAESNIEPLISDSDTFDVKSSISSCEVFPDCGFRLRDSGVILTCLDCFLRHGAVYCFEYGVTSSAFLAKVRGGSCTIAECDPPEMAVHRAMYLLRNGFGNYDVFRNNCEDFALYCKTGLVIVDRQSVGSSGQAATVLSVPLAAFVSSPIKMLIPSPVGVATVAAGMYCMSRYVTDIGIRTDVMKVAVEEIAKVDRMGMNEEASEI